jgi:formyl-CoA transferase
MTTTQIQPGALAGLRVLELGTLIAGPFASRLFAEFGADVIKVEQPKEGDPIRKWRVLHDGNSLWWAVQARNKRCITLNLKSAEGIEIAKQLALKADIIIENNRPGQLEKWGLGFDALSELNPGLIMVRMSGYGQTGPYRDRPGFGSIAEAMGGLRYVSGHPDRPPVRVGISIGDSLAALHAVIGALVALQHRHTTGRGQVVDVALYESVFNMMESTLPEFDFAGVMRERTGGSLPGIVPSNTYTCRDGGHVVIGGNGDAIFKRLMSAIGRDDLANDPALAHNDGRAEQVDLIDEAIGNWCLTVNIDTALDLLTTADVPVSKIYSIADIVTDEQYLARDMLEPQQFKDGKCIRVPAVVPKLSESPGGTRWLGPELGEHTAEVLEELGYKEEQIQSFKKAGVI